MKPSRIVPLLVLALFAVGAVIYSESLKTRAQVGAPIPAFELPQLDGPVQRVDASLGMPLVINFWASWCEPCLVEMPAHDAFYRRYRDRVVYLGINQREPPAKIRTHLDQVAQEGSRFAFPILLDRNGAVGEAFRLGGMPETWFVDPQGVARRHWLGPVTFEQLQAAYYEVTGFPIDAADGGPFHGTGGVRAVLIGPGGEIHIGGRGGVARYRLQEGGAPGADYAWEPVPGDGVLALVRGAAGEPQAVTGRGWPGLPAAPAAVATGHGHHLAWVPDHGLFRAAAPAGDPRAAAGWEPVTPGIGGRDGVAALAADPLVADRWLAATAGGLWESRDGGRTWRSLDLGVRVYGLVFDPAAPERLYLATDTGVWLSHDGGRRAERLAGSPQRVLAALDAAVLPGGGTWLVAAAPNGDVYGSDDGGRTWSLLVPRLAG
ncbi:MAG TPA: redoxin domain-containing protein [Limnochordales bacterium]|nr:redoxin domain-containing protein [Limnochordales bacterium]